jgi:hypothetical protein
MNYTYIVSGGILLLFGTVLFGFDGLESQVVECKITEESWGASAPFVQQLKQQTNGSTLQLKSELKFRVHGNQGLAVDKTALLFSDEVIHEHPSSWLKVYGRTIKRTALLSSNTLEELIRGYPSSWVEAYESVCVKGMLGGTQVSLMNKSNRLSQEQKALLKAQSEIGAYFDLVINFQATDAATGLVKHERINVELTVVPENEAKFPLGDDQLIAYLEENSRDEYSGKALMDFKLSTLKFTISEKGEVEEVHQIHGSGYQNIDLRMVELIQQMPLWIPATDANGNAVKQPFQLLVGRPGC